MKRRTLTTMAAIAVSAATLMGWGCSSQQQVNYPKSTELPVSRVVMYQSGIGYVERTAKVSDDELVLRIRPDQINDILKSLTVIDRGNGRPVSISLPVDKTTLDRLAQIPDQVRDGGIRSLLEAFRGANVKIKTRGASYEGRVVGVDEQKRQREVNISVNDSGKGNDNSTVTLLTNSNVLEVIALSDIKSVSLYDKSLADGLNKSLNISLNEGNWKQLELVIRMDSNKTRELAMSYLVAMPTWKPAYRLVLGDNNKGTLQGWAVVSNVTGADWNDISFSLVSGQPMSFTYDLYKPQFVDRPDLSGLAVQKALSPEVVASGFNAKQELRMNKAVESEYARSERSAAKSASGSAKYRMEAADEDVADTVYFGDDELIEGDLYAPITATEMANNFTQLAEKAQIGSFDEYKLASKLTIPDGNTALVNLIQSELVARDTRLIKSDGIFGFDGFYKGWRNDKSFQTIELENNTGVALDSGPITIYRDSSVIGEGYLSRTEKDASAYITFANEGRLAASVVDTIQQSKQRLDKIQSGQCSFTTTESLTQKFSFESHIQNSTTALLQINRQDIWTPVDFPEKTVKTTDKYIVPVEVGGNETVELALTMKRDNKYSRPLVTRRGSVNLTECREAVKNALADNEIPAADRSNFENFVADVEALDTIAVKTNSLQQRRDEINRDQSSLTQTLAGLKDIKTSNADSLKNQLMQRQKSNEKALVDITSELYNLQVEKGEIDLRMQTYAQTLNYMREL